MTRPADLSNHERELLLALAAEQERFEARRGWDFRHTLWSRVTYTMAAPRGRLTPTHIAGKFDLDRAFEHTFRRLVVRLVKRGLVRFRPIGTGRQPRQTLGYKSHEARVRDIFLTDGGKAVVAALRAAAAPQAPDGQGDTSPPPPDARNTTPAPPPPDGDLGGAPVLAIPEPDGDPGWPERPSEPAEAPATPDPEDAPAAILSDVFIATTAAPAPARPRRVPRPRAERPPRRAPAPRPRSGRRGR